MWLGIIGFVILVVAIVGSIASGGIFTIVLLPLAVVIIVGAVISRGIGQRAQSAAGGRTREDAVKQRRREEPPLPHSPAPDAAGAEVSTPEQQLEARLHQQ